MCYYNRPKMVKFALESIKNQKHKDWELIFVDDGSQNPGRSIVEKILAQDLDKIKFFNTENTKQEKENQGGSIFGMYWSNAMYDTDAEIGIMLCDDDALYENYLEKLSNFYEINLGVVYSYGHVSIFDPTKYEKISDIPTNLDVWINNHTSTINPYHSVDASQVSWRIQKVKDAGIKFPFPQTINLDASFYKQLFKNFGGCNYNELIVQYKGWHEDQLEYHKQTPYEIKDK